MDNKPVSTAYVPLQAPYQIIMYDCDVAMQIGTLVVVEHNTHPSNNSDYAIKTHSHPVVVYEDKSRDSIQNTQLTEHSFLEGAVWNNVEIRDVTTLCLSGSTLTWEAFLSVLWRESLLNMHDNTPFVIVYWHLRKLGIKISPPKERECTIHLGLVIKPEEMGISFQSDITDSLFINVSVTEDGENIIWKDNYKTLDSRVWPDDDSVWHFLELQLDCYRQVLRDVLFDIDVINHFTVTYKTDIEHFKGLVERMNNTDSFVNLV